jgi:protein-disulfide isomerase
MRLAGVMSLVLVIAVSSDVRAVSVADDGRVQGKPDAPLTLIEYSDFTCGYCLKFFKETLPKLQATYIDTGKVRFVYRDYPRADRGVGVEAAVAARCAGAQ